MIYGSVCSGVEAATVAWHPLGWKPAFFSEIEKFPRSVLQCRWPEVPLHGDFTTIKENEYGSIDLLVGGTPCQDFSVAGLRKGLSGDRGNLTLEYVRLAQRKNPRWILWENVPGVLSIDGGRAFGSFLGGLAECGYGFAYRILDAQYFGVPQRRRRVFVVGYLGDWRPAAAVLFERESLHGDITPRREAGQKPARGVAYGVDEECNGTTDVFGSLLRGGQGGTRQSVAYDKTQTGGGVARCLSTSNQRIDAETETLIVSQGGSFDADTAPTVTSNGDAHSGFRDEKGLVCYPINSQIAMRHEALGEGTGMGIGAAYDPSFTLLKNHSHAVAFAQNQAGELRVSDIAGTINTNSNASGRATPMTQVGMAVRRLTPVECERLQGFPDGYTDINAAGGHTPDGPRYKAMGNSMAVPVMSFLGKRIQMIEDIINAS